MEDEEGLVINSILVAPATNKLNQQIEESIIKKICLINDISARIISEIMSRHAMNKVGRQATNQKRITSVQLLPNEIYFVNKLYKYNLQTF